MKPPWHGNVFHITGSLWGNPPVTGTTWAYNIRYPIETHFNSNLEKTRFQEYISKPFDRLKCMFGAIEISRDLRFRCDPDGCLTLQHPLQQYQMLENKIFVAIIYHITQANSKYPISSISTNYFRKTSLDQQSWACLLLSYLSITETKMLSDWQLLVHPVMKVRRQNDIFVAVHDHLP